MIRRPPTSNQAKSLFPYATLFRSTISFQFSKIDVKRHSGGSGSSSYQIFKGIIYVAEFNKDFAGVTQLSTTTEASKIAMYDKIQMGNDKFNSVFNTYTTNEVETRCILSNKLMEKILRLYSEFGAEIQVLFFNSCMIIIQNTQRNNFEAKLFSQINEEEIGRASCRERVSSRV